MIGLLAPTAATATVLAYAIVKEGLKSVAAGITPIEVKRGIDKAVAVAVEEIKKNSRAVKGSEDITHVATVSANNDPEIGKILADAIEKVGKDGVITVEESKNMDTTVKTVEGMQFDSSTGHSRRRRCKGSSRISPLSGCRTGQGPGCSRGCTTWYCR